MAELTGKLISEFPTASSLDDNDLFALSKYSNNSGTITYATRKIAGRNVKYSSFYLGELITSGSDLDDYVEPGSYYINDSAVAAGLSNCPVTNATFRLDVYATSFESSNYRLQVLYGIGFSNIYVRRKPSSSGFSAWYRLLNSVNDFPVSIANGGLGTTTRADAQSKIFLARYVDASQLNLNSMTDPGVYRILIADNSTDAAYLGWSGYAIVEVFGLGGESYTDRWIQRITQMASGKITTRYSMDGTWSYSDLPVSLNFRISISAGGSKTISLLPYSQYVVSSYMHTWVVDTKGTTSAAPKAVVYDLNQSGSAANLTCVAGDGLNVTIANATSYAYTFAITQNL